MPILIDTNILLRVCDRSAAEHQVCVSALAMAARQKDDLYICAQVMIEFWAAATRPRNVNGLGLSVVDASQAVDDALRLASCLPEPPDIAQRWRALAIQFQVQGKKAHDARLVAFMKAHVIGRLLTLNVGDFTRYPDIQAVTPANLLASGTP